jgi:hypothetical protein
MSRAARILSKLYERDPASVDMLRRRTRGITTPLGLVERLIMTGEAAMGTNNGAVPQLRDESETTEVVIDLNLERYLREALRSKMFMRHSDIDDVFAYARELAQKGERR